MSDSWTLTVTRAGCFPPHKLKDPSASRNAVFDWDAVLAPAVAITSPAVLVSGPDTTLVADSVTLLPGNRSIGCRISGGTLRELYRVTCRITTNQTPAQVEDRTVRVRVEQR